MSNTELYRQLEEISSRLHDCGFDTWAVKLDDARAGGSTSGEILMAARSILWELKASHAPIPNDILQSVELAIGYINSLGI